MVIKEESPITMAEVAALAGDSEKGQAIKKFIKDFTNMTAEKAIEMKDELRGLDILKLKEEHIVKLVDFVPKDATDLNKVLSEVSLDQEEINKILEVTAKY